MIAGTSPGIEDIAFLIELDDLRSAHAAKRRSRAELRRQLDRHCGSSPVDEPDVLHVIDVKTRDLLHAPLVRQRLGPKWINAILGRAVGVDRLALDHLSLPD